MTIQFLFVHFTTCPIYFPTNKKHQIFPAFSTLSPGIFRLVPELDPLRGRQRNAGHGALQHADRRPADDVG